MTVPRRIGILTGGGDVPGLNAVIKSVVYRADELGSKVVGIRRGWQGLTHARIDQAADPDHLRPLDPTNTRTIDRTGGTILHSSRTNPRRMGAHELPPALGAAGRSGFEAGDGLFDLTPLVLRNLEALGIECLVTIGGDDTLSFSRVLVDAGVPLVAIPKTMDNDVQGTEYCIGFSSAITRARELINRQRTTLGSHERIGVFRIFGRDAGFSALYAAYVTSGRCVIPEEPYDLERLASVLAADHRDESLALRLRDLSRGRDLARRADGCRRRGGRIRAPAQVQRRRGACGRDQAVDRSRDRGERADLRPAHRASRIPLIRWSRSHSRTSRWT